MTVELSTKRARAGGAQAPVLAWWASDEQLLALDTTLRPELGALVSAGWRAPVWALGTGADLGGAAVGTLDVGSYRGDVVPVVVSDDLQSEVEHHSGMITLPTNGASDSCAPPLIASCKKLIRRGEATPTAVGVAALRAGWWPERVPGLVKKVGGRL